MPHASDSSKRWLGENEHNSNDIVTVMRKRHYWIPTMQSTSPCAGGKMRVKHCVSSLETCKLKKRHLLKCSDHFFSILLLFHWSYNGNLRWDDGFIVRNQQNDTLQSLKPNYRCTSKDTQPISTFNGRGDGEKTFSLSNGKRRVSCVVLLTTLCLVLTSLKAKSRKGYTATNGVANHMIFRNCCGFPNPCSAKR